MKRDMTRLILCLLLSGVTLNADGSQWEKKGFHLPTATIKRQYDTSEKVVGLTVGLKVLAVSKYSGSDDSEILLLPTIEAYFALSDRTVLFLDDASLGFNHALSSVISIGVVGSYRSGRNSADSDALVGMQDIDDAFEVGGYLSYSLNQYTTIDAVGLFDMSDTYDGWVSDFSITMVYPITSTDVIVGFTAGVSYGSQEYNSTYYGVTTTESRSNRTVYRVKSGLNSTNGGIFVSYCLSDRVILNGAVYLTELLDDIGDSPIVLENTELIPLVEINYSF